jgi:transcriptional regulator of met regulon
MALIEVYRDPVGRIVSEYDTEAQVIIPRPYTVEENAEQDAIDTTNESHAANKSTIEINLEADLAAMQAIKDQTNADLRADPSQEIKEIAVAIRRLIKMELEKFEEPE